MQYRPIQLIILAILHLLEPIGKIIMYAFLARISPWQVIVREVSLGTPLSIFEFFFLFPIIGACLYFVKRWTLIAFLALETWVLFANRVSFILLYENGHHFFLFMVILFAFLNIGVCIYLLLPAIRACYLDPKIRWWEACPRYTLNIDCMINKQKGKIINLSYTGVFINIENTKLDVEQNEEFDIQFSLGCSEFSLKAKAIHHMTIAGVEGTGAMLYKLTLKDKFNLKKEIYRLDISDTPRRPSRRNFKNDVVQLYSNYKKQIKALF